MEKERLSLNEANNYVLKGVELLLDIMPLSIDTNIVDGVVDYTLNYKIIHDGIERFGIIKLSNTNYFELLKLGMSLKGGYDILKINRDINDDVIQYKVYYNCFSNTRSRKR